MALNPIFIGGAWPYANGSLHLGHVAALLPGDVLARYFRQKGHPVLYVSGTDCHGTPITVRSEKEGRHPSEIAALYHGEFTSTFKRLGFTYDIYWHTAHPAHGKRVQEIFSRLRNLGWLYERTELQAYCPNEQRFLPDRYIKGICNFCGAQDVRGDQCEICGALLSYGDLKEPRCQICGSEPQFHPSAQLYFRLSALAEPLQQLLKTKTWRENAIGLTQRYLNEGLQDRAATRDLSWGIDVPFADLPDKKIYVWFDAVLGYLTASQEWAGTTGDPTAWKHFWGTATRSYYIHGKDNIPFHTLILPGLLLALNETKQLPDHIVSSEYLTLEGRKFSTSNNWAVWVDDFLTRYQPDSLRYYLLVNGPEGRDANFAWDKFIRRTNSELLGTYGNFIHRTLSLIWSKLGGEVPNCLMTDDRANKELKAWENAYTEAGALLEQAKFKSAILVLFTRLRAANKYIDDMAPWQLLHNDIASARRVLGTCVQMVAAACQLAYPFLPFSSEETLRILGITSPKWRIPRLQPKLKLTAPPIPLINRLDTGVANYERSKLENDAR